MTYPTAAELRRANLLALVAAYRTKRALAERVGVAAAQISQWATAAPDAKTGKPRTISDESARQIEAACATAHDCRTTCSYCAGRCCGVPATR